MSVVHKIAGDATLEQDETTGQLFLRVVAGTEEKRITLGASDGNDELGKMSAVELEKHIQDHVDAARLDLAGRAAVKQNLIAAAQKAK